MPRLALVAALLAGALAVGARPAWHLVQRAQAADMARDIWSGWVERGQPAGGPIDGAVPAFWLRVPTAGIDSLVLDTASGRNLAHFPCLERVPLAGARAPARVVLGHRDSHFRPLDELAPGAPVEIVHAGGGRERLAVTRRLVVPAGRAMSAVRDAVGGRAAGSLILMTCYPVRFIGPAPQRLLLVAEPRPDAINGSARARSWSRRHAGGA